MNCHCCLRHLHFQDSTVSTREDKSVSFEPTWCIYESCGCLPDIWGCCVRQSQWLQVTGESVVWRNWEYQRSSLLLCLCLHSSILLPHHQTQIPLPLPPVQMHHQYWIVLSWWSPITPWSPEARWSLWVKKGLQINDSFFFYMDVCCATVVFQLLMFLRKCNNVWPTT